MSAGESGLTQRERADAKTTGGIDDLVTDPNPKLFSCNGRITVPPTFRQGLPEPEKATEIGFHDGIGSVVIDEPVIVIRQHPQVDCKND